MANTNSTARKDITNPIDAIDALNRANNMIMFLQDVLTLSPGGVIPDNITAGGLYCIFQDIQDNINDARIVLEPLTQTKVEA